MESKLEILHLEDEGPLRDVFRLAITMFDDKIKLVQFENGEDAWEYTQASLKNIKVFVLDIRLPGEIDGLEVARLIRTAGSQRPIVVTSAFVTPQRNLMKELQLEWMPKPLHILNLVQKILPWVYGTVPYGSDSDKYRDC